MVEKEAAFKQIYEANSKKIYHLCYGYTGDDDAASDLLQETFLKVWQNLDKFRNQAMISTWIYRIAVNTCLTYLRSEKRQAKDELTPLISETKREESTTARSKFHAEAQRQKMKDEANTSSFNVA